MNAAIEHLFLRLARGASAGRESALRRLRLLHTAILNREEQGETPSRLLPSGLADSCVPTAAPSIAPNGWSSPCLMSDVRGYSRIAEYTDPGVLAGQLNAHRRAMNSAILSVGGTVMQYVGDAMMAVFGASDTRATTRNAVHAAAEMHARQLALDAEWADSGLAPFGLSIGLSTGEVTAALLGSAERVEYTLVANTVNLAQRLQDLARPAGATVASQATMRATLAEWP